MTNETNFNDAVKALLEGAIRTDSDSVAMVKVSSGYTLTISLEKNEPSEDE